MAPSTQKAEDDGKNSLVTGTLTSSDLENTLDTKGSALGLNANLGVNQPKDSTKPASTGPGINAGQSGGYGKTDDHQHTTTQSGINTANITITDADKQAGTGKTVDQIKADVKTDTTTDTVDLNSGALENTFDKEKVQNELNLQVAVTQEFSKNSQEVRVMINAKAKALFDAADKETDQKKKDALTDEAKKW